MYVLLILSDELLKSVYHLWFTHYLIGVYVCQTHNSVTPDYLLLPYIAIWICNTKPNKYFCDYDNQCSYIIVCDDCDMNVSEEYCTLYGLCIA